MDAPNVTNRREFLRLTIAGAVGTAIAAACSAATPPAPTAVPPAPTATAVPPAQTATTASPAPAVASPTTAAAPAATVAPTAKPTTAAPATIDWSTFGADQSVQKVIDDFNESQDRIVVKITTRQDDQSLATSIAAGTPPSTAHIDRYKVAPWAAQGMLTDLSGPASAAGIAAGQYWPFAWDEVSYKGKLWALPFNTDTRGIYYNVDVLKQAGLDPSKPPKTIAELDAAAAKLTKKAGHTFTRLGYSPMYKQSFHYAVCLEFAPASFDQMYDKATNTCTANAPSNVEAFAWVKSYADKYNEQDMESFTSALDSGANDPFFSGQLPMFAGTDGVVAYLKQTAPTFNYGVMAMPGKAGPAPCMAGGYCEIMPKGAKSLDEGFEFLKYVAGKTVQLTLCLPHFLIPTIVEVAKDPGFTADPKHAKFMDFLKTAVSRPAIPAGEVLWNSLDDAQDAVVKGTKTPKQALDDVKKAVDAELAKYK